jgi:hypothetical protein
MSPTVSRGVSILFAAAKYCYINTKKNNDMYIVPLVKRCQYTVDCKCMYVRLYLCLAWTGTSTYWMSSYTVKGCMELTMCHKLEAGGISLQRTYCAQYENRSYIAGRVETIENKRCINIHMYKTYINTGVCRDLQPKLLRGR